MRNFICALPWIHIATRTDGSTRPCCISDFSDDFLKDKNPKLTNLSLNSLNAIINSERQTKIRQQMLNNFIPQECGICQKMEEKTGTSKRINENDIWTKKLGKIPIEPRVHYLDLRLGSHCNLKCIMCSSQDSSAWKLEGKRFQEKAKNTFLKNQLKISNELSSSSKEDMEWYKPDAPFWRDFWENINDIKQIYFAGGEPLMQPAHNWCIEQIINRKHSKDIELRYNTNLTQLNPRHIELWEQYKSVSITVSLDSVGSKNGYIRFPSNWLQIEDKLKMLDIASERIHISFTMTIQALNILDIKDFFYWKQKSKNKKINYEKVFSNVDFNLLHVPKYLNVKVLPKALKEKALKNFQEMFSLSEDIGLSKYKYWGAMLDYMESEDYSYLWPDFTEYIKLLDESRGLKFKNIFPEIAEYFHES